MSRDLPEFPNLDHLKKQAKALLREMQQSRPEAKLADAQHAVARQYGFQSWIRLKTYVESLPRRTDRAPAAQAGAGQFVRYTQTARKTVFFARFWAGKRGSELIESEHLLLGVIEADKTLLERLLTDPSANETILREIERRKAAGQMHLSAAHRPFSDECRRVLDHAAKEADRLRHGFISPGHFLLGLMREEDLLATSILMDALKERKIGLDEAKDEIIRVLGHLGEG
jgi:hypothetical protein